MKRETQLQPQPILQLLQPLADNPIALDIRVGDLFLSTLAELVMVPDNKLYSISNCCCYINTYKFTVNVYLLAYYYMWFLTPSWTKKP
ncbi:hypothetical protein PROFUN_14756 [Planoprotostelium fungivorum]|uniref:Uncharacterized protein n=1 Tax=Planoprotostelium fungivorum TaxID=1890364 RepID=A0A2P6MY11_9EUKA|nr:hypothetical protein PROFUN_14756 [Planoprotostelium fungivorum]